MKEKLLAYGFWQHGRWYSYNMFDGFVEFCVYSESELCTVIVNWEILDNEEIAGQSPVKESMQIKKELTFEKLVEFINEFSDFYRKWIQ